MNIKTAIEWLKEFPEDYELCFSERMAFVTDDGEEYIITLDDPVTGMLKSDDTKELRFFTSMTKDTFIRELEKNKNWKKLKDINIENKE